jgi:hypothetical protein
MQSYFIHLHFAKTAFKAVLNNSGFLSISHLAMFHCLLIKYMDSDDPSDCYAAYLQTNFRMKPAWRAWVAACC